MRFAEIPILKLLSMIIVDIFIIVGPIIGYIFQYQEIKLTQAIGSFSPFVTFILLTSNILRIQFR